MFWHSNAVCHVAISPDGLRVACGCMDGTVRMWDVKADEQIGMNSKAAQEESLWFRLAQTDGTWSLVQLTEL